MYPWQESVSLQINALAEQQRLPAALAITCAEGWGLSQLLADLSRQLLATDSQQDIAELAHPDFRWVVPDGAVIKIDQIRKLVDFAVQTPQLAPRKIAAIMDAHLLNNNAANALLKTLEEPPPNTHLLLATSHWGKVLPTIRSRCQRYTVHADARLAASWLQQQGLQVSDQDLALAGYAPLKIHDQLQEQDPADTPASAELLVKLDAWLAQLPARSLAAAVEELVAADVSDLLARWYRRLLMAQHQQAIPGVEVNPAQLHLFADLLLNTRRQIDTSNATNVRLLCEALLVEWAKMCRR